MYRVNVLNPLLSLTQRHTSAVVPPQNALSLRTTRPAKLKSSTIKRNAYLESASYASRILNEQIVWKRPEPLSEPGASPFLTICSVSSP